MKNIRLGDLLIELGYITPCLLYTSGSTAEDFSVCRPGCEALGLAVEIFPDSPAVKLPSGTHPVSYTHLDVYKRQGSVWAKVCTAESRDVPPPLLFTGVMRTTKLPLL